MKISVDLPENVDALWLDAVKLAKENGVLVEGDKTKGVFSIKGFRATYTVEGNRITAFAGKVPPFVTEKKIKAEIAKWFSGRTK
jgi:hypothetical protein